MSQKEVYDKFKRIFPQFAENSKMWFPNGKNSIRIRHKNGNDFIFTYNKETDWRFETVEAFIKHLKGE